MCATTPEAELVLASSTQSPGAARAFALRSGCSEHALTVLDDAVLLISELVTNSVLHGGPPIVLNITCDGESMTVRVRDGSQVLPAGRTAGPDAEGGRGLGLVDLLTHTWGVQPVSDRHGDGKEVWFELRASA
jgi:anti-sigma regulatory factor (Ser/Thr protein kinase)